MAAAPSDRERNEWPRLADTYGRPTRTGDRPFDWPPREPLQLSDPAAAPTLIDIYRLLVEMRGAMADVTRRLGEVELELRTLRLSVQSARPAR